MKEIKAYVHSNRIADVIAALKASSVWSAGGNGDHNLTVYMVKGSLVVNSSQGGGSKDTWVVETNESDSPS